jgi:hypothetical protein
MWSSTLADPVAQFLVAPAQAGSRGTVKSLAAGFPLSREPRFNMVGTPSDGRCGLTVDVA